jgi:hypothetical protein
MEAPLDVDKPLNYSLLLIFYTTFRQIEVFAKTFRKNFKLKRDEICENSDNFGR